MSLYYGTTSRHEVRGIDGGPYPQGDLCPTCGEGPEFDAAGACADEWHDSRERYWDDTEVYEDDGGYWRKPTAEELPRVLDALDAAHDRASKGE